MALPIPEHIKGLFKDLQQQMLRHVHQHDQIRWVRPEGIHLTMNFLGDTEEQDIEKISPVLDSLATQLDPFRLVLADTGCFPHANNPRVLWLSVQGGELILPGLKQKMDTIISEHGYPVEKRKFSPHITLGRIKRLVRNSNLVHNFISHDVTALSFDVSELVWYQSTLTSGGAKYSILKRFALGTEA